MPGRLPTQRDFATSAKLSITPPPASQLSTNILILLHGLGDTNASFTSLGQQLNLPDTACIALQAPSPMPFDLGGFHWGDDLIFDENTGEMDVDTGFKATVRLLLDNIIRDGLMGKCGYSPRDIIIFGFAQGAMVGLQAVAETRNDELGGVISIGGVLPLSTSVRSLGKKNRTPVLLCKAVKGSAVTDSAISRLKDAFDFVDIKEWKKKGDGMPSNRDEMLPVMQFLARRLRSTRGVLAGSVELN